MLGLRFYACRDCERVHAEPVATQGCPECGSNALTGIGDNRQAKAYFRPGTDA